MDYMINKRKLICNAVLIGSISSVCVVRFFGARVIDKLTQKHKQTSTEKNILLRCSSNSTGVLKSLEFGNLKEKRKKRSHKFKEC